MERVIFAASPLARAKFSPHGGDARQPTRDSLKAASTHIASVLRLELVHRRRDPTNRLRRLRSLRERAVP
jgi:hypothetical protein